VSADAPFGNWMVAVAEAADLAHVPELEKATAEQMTRAWGLVRKAAGISPADLAERIAGEAHLDVAELRRADARASALIPAAVARRRNVLPLRCSDREIRVATANPLNQAARRQINGLTGRTVVFEVAPPEEISAAITGTYGPAAPGEGEPADVEIPLPKGPHILVVDDEAGQRALVRSVLEEAGFRVDVAPDGPSAVEMMERDPSYDLVALDYWMDRMNGLRVLQLLRASAGTASMPVIMVTGAGDRQIEMSLFEAGADDYISKPIDGPLFVLRVKAVLRRRRLG
jgi:CheY-like chemotaxis protein